MAAHALLLLLLFFSRATGSNSASNPPVCPLNTVPEFVFPSKNDVCSAGGGGGVIQGNEITLQKTLSSIHRNEYEYAALLFYSSWCPFSLPLRPIFSMLSSIFPSIPHFAIEESSIRPSILSKYGVHGFPSLILLNSTMRVRYQGSRTLDSLIAFYKEFTGNLVPLEGNGSSSRCSVKDEKSFEEEGCPFPWARSPENLLRQETYLTLATIFVISRLVHLIFPTFRRYARSAWRRYSSSTVPAAYYVNQILLVLVQSFKGRNLLQEGAKTWASKSLSTVSLADTPDS
ncbi:hypothetical protein M569_11894, partial [Genlisea aurea]